MSGVPDRFQKTYSRDFGNVQGNSNRKKMLSSSTSNLFDSGAPGIFSRKPKKNVSFGTPSVFNQKNVIINRFGNTLGVQPLKRSSSHQNIPSDINSFEHKMNLFGSSDDFDNGFSSDDNSKEGRIFCLFSSQQKVSNIPLTIDTDSPLGFF